MWCLLVKKICITTSSFQKIVTRCQTSTIVNNTGEPHYNIEKSEAHAVIMMIYPRAYFIRKFIQVAVLCQVLF